MRRFLTGLVFAAGLFLLTTQLVVGLSLLAVVGVADLVLDKVEGRTTTNPRT